jgi:hypothetical protein
MKIVHVETIIGCGEYANSSYWAATRRTIHEAVKKCDWPAGSGKFTIYPERKANGVVPIKKEFIQGLKAHGWVIEGPAKNKEGQSVGDFDAVIAGPNGPIVAEWETGNISSSHRTMTKLLMLNQQRVIAAGVLVIPSKALYLFLTDRIGNFTELTPYLGFWKTTSCKSGIVEIVVIEQDAESTDVPKIPKGTDGRAKG